MNGIYVTSVYCSIVLYSMCSKTNHELIGLGICWTSYIPGLYPPPPPLDSVRTAGWLLFSLSLVAFEVREFNFTKW